MDADNGNDNNDNDRPQMTQIDRTTTIRLAGHLDRLWV